MNEEYWERRYRGGGKSGTIGRPRSQDERRYQWRAEIINRVAADYGVESVLDIGSGDGLQARLLDVPGYLGMDVSPTAVEIAGKRCPDKEFVEFTPEVEPRDMHLSLSVMFHLVDDMDFYRHLDLLFGAKKVVVVYASDHDERGWTHVLHRRWTNEVPPPWVCVEKVPEGFGHNFVTVWAC